VNLLVQKKSARRGQVDQKRSEFFASAKISIPKDRDVWSCSWADVDWYVFPNQNATSWDGQTYTVFITRVRDEKFSAYADIFEGQGSGGSTLFGGWLSRFGYYSLDARAISGSGYASDVSEIHSRLRGHKPLGDQSSGNGATCSRVTKAH